MANAAQSGIGKPISVRSARGFRSMDDSDVRDRFGRRHACVALIRMYFVSTVQVDIPLP